MDAHLRDEEGSSHQDQGDTNHHASAQRGWRSLRGGNWVVVNWERFGDEPKKWEEQTNTLFFYISFTLVLDLRGSQYINPHNTSTNAYKCNLLSCTEPFYAPFPTKLAVDSTAPPESNIGSGGGGGGAVFLPGFWNSSWTSNWFPRICAARDISSNINFHSGTLLLWTSICISGHTTLKVSLVTPSSGSSFAPTSIFAPALNSGCEQMSKTLLKSSGALISSMRLEAGACQISRLGIELLLLFILFWTSSHSCWTIWRSKVVSPEVCKAWTAKRTNVYVLKPPVARSPSRRHRAQCFKSRRTGARIGSFSQNSRTRRELDKPSKLFTETSQSTWSLVPQNLSTGTLAFCAQSFVIPVSPPERWAWSLNNRSALKCNALLSIPMAPLASVGCRVGSVRAGGGGIDGMGGGGGFGSRGGGGGRDRSSMGLVGPGGGGGGASGTRGAFGPKMVRIFCSSTIQLKSTSEPCINVPLLQEP